MMKKILKFISVIMMIITGLAVLLLIYTFFESGADGFIDLTNVVRYFLVGIGAVAGLFAFITGYFGWKK